MQGGLTAIPALGIKDKSNHEKQQKQTKPVIETQQSKIFFLHINLIFLTNKKRKVCSVLRSEVFYTKILFLIISSPRLDMRIIEKNWRQI